MKHFPTPHINNQPVPENGSYVLANVPLPIDMLTRQCFLIMEERTRPALVLGSDRSGDNIVLAYQTAKEKLLDPRFVSLEGRTYGLNPTPTGKGPFLNRYGLIALPREKTYFPRGLDMIGYMEEEFFYGLTHGGLMLDGKIPKAAHAMRPGMVISDIAKYDGKKSVSGWVRHDRKSGIFTAAPK